MEFKDYESRLLELNKRYNEERSALANEYALSNNPYQVGDIFTDHMGAIKVESVSVFMNYKVPCCSYYGLELKKDGTPTKKEKKRYAWQMNDINKSILQQ